MKKALIHYFSGTGNTYHAMKKIALNLEDEGFEILYADMDKGYTLNLNEYDIYLFAFPIYGFGMPTLVLNYLKDLDNVKNKKAVVICTCGGNEGQGIKYAKSILSKKGFDVFYTDAVVFPSNWTQATNPLEEDKIIELFEVADIKINNITNRIGNFERNNKNFNIVGIILSWFVFLMFSLVGRRILGKTYIADSSCNSCEKCKGVCPTKVITMSSGKPTWGWSCESCQRCMNFCPERSIQTSILKLAIYLAIEVAPIFLLVYLNKKLYISSFLIAIIDIVIYILAFLILHYIMDKLICILEAIPSIRKIFQYSFTTNNRRYIIKEFQVTKK